MDVTIRRYKPGDEIQIAELFRAIFHARKPMDLWQWQFLNNPAGNRNIAIAEDKKEGRIVAHYAGAVTSLNYNNKTVKASLIVDSMVHPDFRRSLKKKGIFQRTYETYIRNSFKDGIKFFFGYPNKAAMRIGCRLLEYKIIGPVPLWSYRSSHIGMLKHRFFILRSWPGVPNKLTIRYVKRFGTEIDQLWEELKPHYPVATVRDSTYLNWRYAERPDSIYELVLMSETSSKKAVGIAVFGAELKQPGDNGTILELLAHPQNKEAISSLLEFSIYHFAKRRKSGILAWLPKKGYVEECARLVGFKEERCELTMVGRSVSPEVEFAFVKENFYYTMGDSDLY